MIAWIWLGGLVVVLGGLVALWPQGHRALARMTAAEAARAAGGAEASP